MNARLLLALLPALCPLSLSAEDPGPAALALCGEVPKLAADTP